MRARKAWLGIAGLWIALGLGTSVAEAQLPSVAPGPMSRAHAHLDGLTDCEKCHEGGTGVPDKKCLGCHDHRDLRKRIEAKKGFHAAKQVTKKRCKECHAEHIEVPPGSGKGRKTTVDWRPFGGKRNFEHQLAGWPLEGAHRFAKCEECHKKKSKRTKLTVYLGLRSDCTSCHENPHEFKDARLTDCTICHSFSDRKVKNLGVTKFDHDKTEFPLKGLHKKEACTECHGAKAEKFTVENKDFSDCKGCHEDSHKSVISKNRRCDSCHKNEVKFRRTQFDHGKETRFKLRGQHAKNRCKDCHKVGSKPEAPSMRCEGCHEDIHKGRFGKETCNGCHTETSWTRQLVYDHNKKTKFELTGEHAKSTCTDCHRGGLAKNFERFESTKCADCHKHQDAHCGQFGLENCERCHVQGGDRTSRFDHNATRFALDGAHAKQGCERCHKPATLGASASCKNAVKYTGLEPQCDGCHEDIHDGTLGKDCAKCHTGGRDFENLAFDHNRDSEFPLTGYHQLVQCETCHPNRKYKLGETRCESCHLEDDTHDMKLGDDCGKCHETTGGAPKFDHDVHTDFMLAGVHERVECERCHYLPPPEERSDPSALAPPGAPIDLQYRVSGKDCAACHPDPHGVRPKPAEEAPAPKTRSKGARGDEGTNDASEPTSATRPEAGTTLTAHRAPVTDLDCGRCHGFDGWKAPPNNGYHERVGFALKDSHTVLECGLCHTGEGQLSGRGEQCGTCHVADDVHYGSFGNDCGRCHDQLAWLPSSFTHNDVGFALQGIHRMIDCRSCHAAGNYFIGDRCWNCHLMDYRAAGFHGADVQPRNGQNVYVIGSLGNADKKSFDCDECHNQFGWDQSAFFIPRSEREMMQQQGGQ